MLQHAQSNIEAKYFVDDGTQGTTLMLLLKDKDLIIKSRLSCVLGRKFDRHVN